MGFQEIFLGRTGSSPVCRAAIQRWLRSIEILTSRSRNLVLTGPF